MVQGSHCQIRIEIGSADTALDADALRAVAAEAVASGAVILRPDRLGRRKGTRHEALVGVDVGRQEVSDLRSVVQQSRHVMLHGL